MSNKLYPQYILVIAAMVLFSTGNIHAQESNCNAFMLGNYLEIGINWNGAFGASTTPPVGYHPTSTASLHNTTTCGGALYTGTSLGFVADPEQNGWGLGSPNYFGDYILPGGAQEGWSIMADGVQKNAWNTDAATMDTISDMNAYIMSYTDTSGSKMTKTQAVYNGLYVTQFIHLDTAKLYFTVQVLIENTNLFAMSDIFFMRTINPHNDQILSGDLRTWNKIEYQTPPDTANRAVVTARGTMYNSSFLALGSKDFRAKAFITKNGITPSAVTLDYLYLGDTGFVYNLNDSILGNTSIGLVYDLGILNSGGHALFTFFYAFRPDVIEEAISNAGVGITEEQLLAKKYALYPNPVTNSFRVSGTERNDILVLYDLVGHKLEEYTNTWNYELSVGNYAPGTYILVVKDKTGYIKGRLPLQKL